MPRRRVHDKTALSTSAELWRALCKQGGLTIAWRKGKPIDTYDRALESDVSNALFGRDDEPLERMLRDSHVSTALLVQALFAALQPFSQMLNDIYMMLRTASASEQDEVVRVTIRPDGLDESLRATLEQFREWAGEVRLVSSRVFNPVWTLTALWDLRRAFSADSDDWSQPPHDPWDDEYRRTDGFPTPPAYVPTGDESFDRAAARAYETVDWFVKSARRLAEGHTALAEVFRQAGGFTKAAEEVADPVMDDLRLIAAAESDYWPVGLLSEVRGARARLIAMASADRVSEGRRTLAAVDAVVASLEQSLAMVDDFERVLGDIFRLPVWSHRSAIYSVWVATQIVAALRPRPVTFTPSQGQLDFGFSGSRLAMIRSGSETYELWSELRTVLLRPTSAYRKYSIQPDYRIVSSVNAQQPESTRVVIECKHYKRSHSRNFSEAINDYGVSCPNASVVLANYGSIGKGVVHYVEQGVADRVTIIPRLRPGADIAPLADVMNRSLPGWVQVPGPWQEPGVVRLTWGPPLRDLDLYVRVRRAGAVSEVSYRRPSDEVVGIELGDDVRVAPGKEVAEISSWQGDRYDVYVHNYSAVGAIAGSNARVTVEVGAEIWQFEAPIDADGRWWYVCAIVPAARAVSLVGRLSAVLEG